MISKSRGVWLTLASLISLLLVNSASAVTEVATGTNAEICNQSVSSLTGVVAERLGQDCIVTFTNTSEITWTVPSGISRVSAIIVGGGGGGGDSTASATGGGGGAGGFFANSSIYVEGSIPIVAGSGGSGSSTTTQGGNGGTSYLGTLKVGGGGGGNGVNYAGGARARAGVGGADFVSSGNGGGGRPTGTVSYTNEYLGGLSGDIASAGVVFLNNTYFGFQGSSGGRNVDGASGGFGGSITSANRTSSISGTSVVYAKNSGYWAWESGSSTAGTKTPGSGGSMNYNYGTDPYGSGGAGANGIVIIRYTINPSLSNPTFTGDVVKGLNESMTVTSNISSKVNFYIEGKRIPTCQRISTTGLWPTYTATCSWKPSISGIRSVYAMATPMDGTTATVTSAKTTLFIYKRVNQK